jgi:CheY-like chemotaxis protein
MDDDAGVRRVGERMLTTLGLDVTAVENGAAAISEYQRAVVERRPYLVVVLDLTVPGGMGGRRALEELRRIDPNVTAVVSSGYSHDSVMSQHLEFGFRGAVHKPYRLDELRRGIEAALAHRDGT